VNALLLNEPVKSLRDAGCRIGDGDHRAVAGDVCQGLPAWAGEGIGVAHSVRPAEFALNRDQKVAIHGGRRKEDGRGTNPKTALNGKAGAAWHGGKGLCDGAAHLKTGAATERCASAGNHIASDTEPRAALGERCS